MKRTCSVLSMGLWLFACGDDVEGGDTEADSETEDAEEETSADEEESDAGTSSGSSTDEDSTSSSTSSTSTSDTTETSEDDSGSETSTGSTDDADASESESGSDNTTGSETGTGTDASTDTGTDESSSTGEGACTEHEDCEGLEGTPYCFDQQCVACTAFADGASSCADEVDGEVPVCLEHTGECVACNGSDLGSCDEIQVCQSDYTCGACTEHAQCASGGCELDTGECITTNVYYVNGAALYCPGVGQGTQQEPDCTIEAAQVRIANDEKGVIHIAAGTYGENVLQPTNRTIVLVGAAAAQVVVNGGGQNVLTALSDTGKLFLAGLSLADTSERAFVCTSEARVWLDDVAIHDAELGGVDITDCTVHMRRSAIYDSAAGGVIAAGGTLTLEDVDVYGNDGGGVMLTNVAAEIRRSEVFANPGAGIVVDGGSLRLENAFVSGNGGMMGSGALQVAGMAIIDVAYSTLAANFTNVGGATGGIDCTGSPTITVRNSILTNAAAGTVLQSSCVDAVITYTSTSDADVAMEATNELVGYDESHFASVATGNLHLSTTGKAVFQAECLPEGEDPTHDIDGDARPVNPEMDYRGADVPQ